MVYVGMDVHRKRSQVSMVDESGAQVMSRNVPNDWGELMPILGSLEPGTPVALEAAYGWGWLADLLDELGLEPHLAHPAACKAIASAKLKDDKLDARTLANLLRTDYLAEAWIAPKEVRDLRALLRHRATLVRFSTSVKNRVHAVLADRGERVPEEGLWTKAGRRWLETVELSPIRRQVIDDCTALIDSMEPLVAQADRDIRRLARPDDRVEALMTVPGIGWITAMTLVAEIGDIDRFPTARKLCAWAGLVPARRNSDNKVRHGHITKQGPRAVRHVLGEAAHVAIRKGPFAAQFAATARRRGKGIALVKVSRKLLTRCFHVLKEVSEKQQRPGEGLRTGSVRETACA